MNDSTSSDLLRWITRAMASVGPFADFFFTFLERALMVGALQALIMHIKPATLPITAAIVVGLVYVVAFALLTTWTGLYLVSVVPGSLIERVRSPGLRLTLRLGSLVIFATLGWVTSNAIAKLVMVIAAQVH